MNQTAHTSTTKKAEGDITLPSAKEFLRRDGLSEVQTFEPPFRGSGHVKGQVETLLTVGPYILARGKENPGFLILDERGAPVDVSGEHCALGFSARDIIRAMEELRCSALTFEKSGKLTVSALCDHLCLMPQEASNLTAALAGLPRKDSGSVTV